MEEGKAADMEVDTNDDDRGEQLLGDTRATLIRSDNLQEGERIGRGTSADVFKGIYTNNRESLTVAIKIISAKAILSHRTDNVIDIREALDILTKYIKREVVILARLNHPHIIKLHGVCIKDTAEGLPEYHIVTDLIDEEPNNLQHLLDDFIPSPKLRMRILCDIADAFKFIRAHAIMHRDLKTYNILTRNLRAVICDFGLSKEVVPLAIHSNDVDGIGSPKYMAPEILKSTTNYSMEIDICSFGVIMHYVLTGISPKKRLMLAPDSLPFSNEMPPSIPRELWDLLLACVNCEPKQRPGWDVIYFYWTKSIKPPLEK